VKAAKGAAAVVVVRAVAKEDQEGSGRGEAVVAKAGRAASDRADLGAARAEVVDKAGLGAVSAGVAAAKVDRAAEGSKVDREVRTASRAA